MVKTVSILHDELKNYSNIKSKIQSLCSKGDLYPLVRNRGLYETDGSLPGYCLALIINGPSYLSFEFALSRHGLIPEAVYAFTSATFETGKKKTYTNHFGTFTYRDVPAEDVETFYGVLARFGENLAQLNGKSVPEPGEEPDGN